MYESTSTTFLLNPSKNVPSTLTVQDTDDESNYFDNTDDDNDENDITLWSSISDEDDSDENNLSGLESNNTYELQECPIWEEIGEL
ncbi:hypothetical protein C2G38_2232278 [Gigaspora rosea]|uniref:Uncharacterized protein n=1 Tax=Gigaspora rosea TaxID=44941 RepID=A0A397TX47_9GLOM|nr:hypothetical protein C2G38_2232278 [Gigaspora rosea]